MIPVCFLVLTQLNTQISHTEVEFNLSTENNTRHKNIRKKQKQTNTKKPHQTDNIRVPQEWVITAYEQELLLAQVFRIGFLSGKFYFKLLRFN